MALDNVTQPTAREIYSASAKYLVSTESSSREMLDDASCFLNSIISTIDMLAIELGDDGSQTQANPKDAASMLWGVYHQLGMVKGIVDAVQVDA